MKGGGLLAILAGKPKKADDEEKEEKSEASPSGGADGFLSAAFSAIEDGNEKAFKRAMKNAISACYEDD